MADAAPETIFDAVGENGITQLVRAFYAQVPGDEVLGPMYATADLEVAERHLRGFLIYRFGGPDWYIKERGNPRLRMRHGPFVVNALARDRWVKLMSAALDTTNFPGPVDAALRAFFAETATFLINHDS